MNMLCLKRTLLNPNGVHRFCSGSRGRGTMLGFPFRSCFPLIEHWNARHVSFQEFDVTRSAINGLFDVMAV